jgi:hypothetical protein
MTQQVRISNLPVFPRGTFSQHPDLFGRFEQNSPDFLQARYERLWRAMPAYEGKITWPLLTGPGFSAATHPGADTVFVDIMVGINSYVYNSDCVYVNPARGVFAVSDPPGITTGSRRLFERLDGYLRVEEDDLADYVNRLNAETRNEEGATLSLVHVPPGRRDKAFIIVAGDSLLFHGNAGRRALRPIAGNVNFIGTPYSQFQASEVALSPGDFFLIASDGIHSLARTLGCGRAETALADLLAGGIDGFVQRAMAACNSYYREHIYNITMGRFGGSDNVSLVLVVPEQLQLASEQEPIILGGYIEERGP